MNDVLASLICGHGGYQTHKNSTGGIQMAEAALPVSTSEKVEGKSTLLPRSMGLFSAFVFAAATISLASAGLASFSIVFGRYPGVSILGILAVGALVCILNAYVYSVIGAAVRRSGADYILASRVLNPAIAFAFSAAMIVFAGLVVGKITAQISQSVLPVFLRSISTILNSPALLLSADALTTPQGMSFAGSMIIVLVFILCILPQRLNQRLLQVGFGLVVASWVVLFYQFLFPSVAFPASWDRFMGVGTFAMQVKLAADAGMPSFDGRSMFWVIGLLLAFWIYFGFQTPTFLAGEVKKPQVNLLASSVGAVLVTLLILGLGSFLLLRLVPAEWLSAQSYLYLSGARAMPWINFYAAVLRPDPILVGFVCLAWIFSFLNIIQAYFTFCSRIILAWVEDGILPRLAGYVHPQLKSPVVAVLVIAILSQIGVIVAALGQKTISTDFGFIFFAIFTQLFAVIAAMLMPFRKKEWFASQGKFVGFKIGPLPVISLASLVLLGYFVWLLVNIIGTPVMLLQAAVSLVVLGVLFAIGILYFNLRRVYQRGEGIDALEVFKSFPNPND
jgi:basic amino acid/polyamine antiporter, APA family